MLNKKEFDMNTVDNYILLFNDVNNTSFRRKSEATRIMFNAVSDYEDDQIKEVIKENKADDIKDIINPSFFKLYFTNKAKFEQVKDEQKKKETIAETAMKWADKDVFTNALAKTMVEQFAPAIAQLSKEQVDQYVSDTYGTIKKTVEYVVPQSAKTVKGVVHSEFETVLDFVLADEPVFLSGPAGSGKNVLVQQVADALGLDFYFSNAISQEYKLTGFIDANGTYHETQFYKAFKNGGVFMLDEIDASIPEVLVILNSAIANRYFDFPNGKVMAHKDFRVIAAGNTFGTGADYIYTGRNQLDGATLDRFAIVEINYDENIENCITDDKALLTFVREYRKACQDSGLNQVVSYRGLGRMSKMRKGTKMPIAKILKTCLTRGMEKDDIRMVIDHLNTHNEWYDGLRELVD